MDPAGGFAQAVTHLGFFALQQYSIWPDYKAIPNGWRAVGKSGLKPECLAYIEEVWTDMRPLSLRQKMDAVATH